jgi:N-acetylglutamate synthase-like GNAT family acetyltransferase
LYLVNNIDKITKYIITGNNNVRRTIMLHFRKAKPEDDFEMLIRKGKIEEGRRDMVMLAFNGQQLIGVCSLEIDGELGRINSIYIDEGKRNEGIGFGLVKSILFSVDKKGVKKVQVPVKGEIEKFFEKLGFRATGEDSKGLEVSLRGYFDGCCNNALK